MPRIAQQQINDGSVTIGAVTYLDPTPSNISLTMQGELHSTSIFTPELSAYNVTFWNIAANGSWATEPLVTFPLPKIHATHTANISVANEVVSIPNYDQLTDYAIQVLTSETLTTGMTGRPQLSLGALPVVTVQINKTASYKGMSTLICHSLQDRRKTILKQK